MIDIETFATLPAKTCFMFLTDGQGLTNWMDPATHFFPVPALFTIFFLKERYYGILRKLLVAARHLAEESFLYHNS
jgi:hypothetical protein